MDERKSESEKLDQPDENLGEKVHKRKSGFERTSDRIEQYLSGIDRAQTTREISEGLEMTPSTVHGTLQLMEVFGTVQKAKRGSYYYFLKGVYDEEQISAMLPPGKVKPAPRRRSILRSSRRSEFLARESILEEHLSSMRLKASLGEGPSALAMIGLTQHEMIEEEVLVEELPGELDMDLKVKERVVEAPEKVEAFATVEHLPKDARRINSGQIKYLKEQLKGLDGYDKIERFTTAFAEFSALKNGSYGTVFYFSMGTNPWEQVYRVTVDDFLSLETEKPRGRGKSKYDPIIDQFIESGHDLVEIGVEERNPDYIASQLRRRIEDRGLEIAASSVGGFVYLENKR